MFWLICATKICGDLKCLNAPVHTENSYSVSLHAYFYSRFSLKEIIWSMISNKPCITAWFQKENQSQESMETFCKLNSEWQKEIIHCNHLIVQNGGPWSDNLGSRAPNGTKRSCRPERKLLSRTTAAHKFTILCESPFHGIYFIIFMTYNFVPGNVPINYMLSLLSRSFVFPASPTIANKFL